jgi:hypothetical protein
MKQGNLVLTGPERQIISADGPIWFRIHLHDSSREFSIEENWENGVNVHEDIRIYDWPISLTMDTPYGPAEVMYAIISLFGRIVARSELFDIGCVLFYNEHVKGICARSGELIPLARNLLAVPLYKPLAIELDLHSYYGDEIMRETLESFIPWPKASKWHVLSARVVLKSK